MARLNDLPAPTDSIEALKRRFVRQNREIARANSVQSLRIQSLECEVTHLLRENATLREQIIILGQDGERFETARLFRKNIYDYKGKIESKLAELGSLVEEMGALPENLMRNPSHRTREGDAEERNIHPPSRLSSIFRDECGRLPVILEDKYYPRRTLEPEELEEVVVTSDFDSPTIGPPPVAHLEVDQSPDPKSNVEVLDFTRLDGMQHGDDEPTITSNQNLHEMSFAGKAPQSLQNQSPVRSGGVLESKPMKAAIRPASKRKFSATETDDDFSSKANLIDDGFQFSRPTGIERATEVSKNGSNQPIDAGQVVKKGLRKVGTSKRKALEPKSTNTTPNSPKKRHDVALADQKRYTKMGRSAETTQPDMFTKSSQMRDKGSEVPLGKPEMALIGKSHFVSEFSAPDSPVSTSRQNDPTSSSRSLEQDTLEEDPAFTETKSRPSRRPRATISYAEPNLRDKMRRPTNELVDAVAAGQFRRTSSSHADTSNVGRDENECDSNAKKSHIAVEEDNSLISSIYGHGLSGTASAAEQETFHRVSELPKSVITERKRRTSSAANDEIRRSQERDNPTEHMDSNRTKRATSTARPPRRHSSNPGGTYRDTPSENDYLNISNTLESNEGPLRPLEDSGRIQDLNAFGQTSRKEHDHPERGRLGYVDNVSKQPVDMAAEELRIKRSQRAAARRRSMLL